MQSIQELYLQHWNGITRIFPAAPADWKDISFKNLRTSGAFLISAIRKNGKNTEVNIYSEKGGQIKIKPNFEGAFTLSGFAKLIRHSNSVYVYKIPKGKTLTLKAN
ncbi:glycoside hydrolase family 95-like protein [Elizabethkingia anophelis]